MNSGQKWGLQGRRIYVSRLKKMTPRTVDHSASVGAYCLAVAALPAADRTTGKPAISLVKRF